jgi:hypothetical protein
MYSITPEKFSVVFLEGSRSAQRRHKGHEEKDKKYKIQKTYTFILNNH